MMLECELVKDVSLECELETGGTADLGTKSITANGAYAASSDNLDGYSEVMVNVPSDISVQPSVPQTKVTDIIIVDNEYYLWRAS